MDKDQIKAILRRHPMFYILNAVDPPDKHKQIEWNRYLPFLSYYSSWIPYHKTYSALWAAKKYPAWYSNKDNDIFIMDLRNGEIVYKDWENE